MTIAKRQIGDVRTMAKLLEIIFWILANSNKRSKN